MKTIDPRLVSAWHALATPFHCRMTRDAFLEGIVNRYAEPHRHYHTLEHIAEMLATIDEHRERLEEYEALAFATWFHDVVHDPREPTNEDRSAVLARRTLRRLQVPAFIGNRVEALIRATADHVVPDRSFDAALFIDADLAILGADPDRYDRYARDIRSEYAHVGDDDYRAGRRAVLERFLRRDRIFTTDVLHERLDASARANIARELARL